MEIELDSTKIALRLSGVLKKRQATLDSEVLKDSKQIRTRKEGVLQEIRYSLYKAWFWTCTMAHFLCTETILLRRKAIKKLITQKTNWLNLNGVSMQR